MGQQTDRKPQSAKDVFARGRPGHRLHVQRVEGEDPGQEGARPNLPGETPKRRKQQQARHHVEQQAGGVEGSRRNSPEFRIQHPGQARQRKPVGTLSGFEGPDPTV